MLIDWVKLKKEKKKKTTVRFGLMFIRLDSTNFFSKIYNLLLKQKRLLTLFENPLTSFSIGGFHLSNNDQNVVNVRPMQ